MMVLEVAGRLGVAASLPARELRAVIRERFGDWQSKLTRQTAPTPSM